MELAPDITPDDLKVFLEEAEENLQSLDQDILQLERVGADVELLQRIFRAAHTLKGSSAMLGYEEMAQVAHSKESVLDQLRHETLAVSTPVIEALLQGLDGLQALTEVLSDPNVVPIDIAPIKAAFAVILESEQSGASAEDSPDQGEAFALDANQSERLTIALAGGQNAVSVHIRFPQDTEWAAVSAFQVLTELAQLGEIIVSAPSEKEIEEANVDNKFDAVLATTWDSDAVHKSLTTVPDIDSIDIASYEMSSTPAPVAREAAQAATASDESNQGTPPKEESTGKRSSQAGQTVRIDVERLDMLMNAIGELVIDRNRITQIGKVLGSKYKEDDYVQALGVTSTHIAKVVNELQEEVMRARMLPIGTVFSGFPRMVRDLTQREEKKVDFVVSGEETGIDRTVIERIRDPLIHLLRNGIDHGIESPEERQAAGKPETATLELSAEHEQGNIVIRIRDNGRGIDLDKLREATINKGMISAEAAGRLSDQETLELIFLPGSSTAASVTEVSGRGVGMDIVKTNIESMNGFVTLDTELGEGTTFTLRLPLSLATIQGMLVSCGDAVYAIPLLYVLEIIALKASDISTIVHDDVVTIRGDVVPLIRLKDALGINSNESTDGVQYMVIVKVGEKLAGLSVDSVMEPQDLVVKSLGTYASGGKGIMGASILGDGRVALILDVVNLIQSKALAVMAA